jgi:hypothetical protein
MVWANATDNQQVDKPVKPVATISRFAKLKNTKPWYQHFNLVVSPEFSGNHFSGGTLRSVRFEDFKYTLNNFVTNHSDDRSSSLYAMLGGQIKSNSIYVRVGYSKTNRREVRNRTTYAEDDTGNDTGDKLIESSIGNFEENGHKAELTLFGQYQLSPLLHIGYELYRESYEIGVRSQKSLFNDCTAEFYNKKDCEMAKLNDAYNHASETLQLYPSKTNFYKGNAFGGSVNLGARYELNHTQLTMDYTYSHERYRGRYFGDSAYTKLGHDIELSIYHRWKYGLSTELSLAQVHEDANYPMYDRRIGGNISQRISFQVKTLVTENTALSINYTRMNFSDFRQGYDFAAWFLRLDYQFSNGKQPRRRKRHNNLMRLPQ